MTASAENLIIPVTEIPPEESPSPDQPASNARPWSARARDRVQLILNSTYDVLRNDGVRALSTNNIVARAGIPVSSIYQYFPNKGAILLGPDENDLGGMDY